MVQKEYEGTLKGVILSCFSDVFQWNKIITILLMNKNTFEMNDLNNYLSLRQGKKHFWGIKGKDYGFVQSRANQQRSQGIPELKQHYAKVSRHNYDLENLHQGHEEPFSSYERSKDFQFPREKKKMEFIEHYDEGQSKKR